MFANSAAGAVARDHGVAPGALVVAGLGEVEREQVGFLVDELAGAFARARAPTRRWMSRRRRNESPSYAVARIRSCLNVNESPAARDDELAEAAPAHAVRRAGDLARAGSRRRQLELERRPDDRRVAQQHPVRRVERVDARRQQRLDRLGQLVRCSVARGEDELAQEERVAACARAPERSTASVRERVLLGDGERERLRVGGRRAVRARAARRAPPVASGRIDRTVVSSRRRATAAARAARRGAAAGTATRRRASARPRRRSASASSARARGSLDDGVEPVAAVLRIEALDLRRLVDGRVERDREQRQPRREVGHHRLHPRLRAALRPRLAATGRV